jgi:hypothetical protein
MAVRVHKIVNGHSINVFGVHNLFSQVRDLNTVTAVFSDGGHLGGGRIDGINRI